MAASAFRYLQRLMARGALDGRAPPIGHRQQLLVDCGSALMLLGAIVLTHQLRGTSAAAASNAELLALGLVLWLLGAALAMLSLVAPQFPRLAATGATLARALRNYLLGGL